MMLTLRCRPHGHTVGIPQIPPPDAINPYANTLFRITSAYNIAKGDSKLCRPGCAHIVNIIGARLQSDKFPARTLSWPRRPVKKKPAETIAVRRSNDNADTYFAANENVSIPPPTPAALSHTITRVDIEKFRAVGSVCMCSMRVCVSCECSNPAANPAPRARSKHVHN